MSGLPTGWESAVFGEVMRIVSGGTPPSKDETNFAAKGGIPWLTPADLSGYRETYISGGARNLSEKGYATCSATKIPAGSVLFSSRAPIGYVAIASNEISTNQGFKSFVLPDGMNSHFLYYYLKHIKPVAEQMATGTTFKELSGTATAKLPLLVAPLPEQKRIADKLDSVLARVDACRDRLDRLPALLKRFRQSILAAATSGRLTEDWRSGISPGWEDCKLGDLLKGKPRNGYSPKAVDYCTPVKSLTLSATTSGKFKSEHIKFIDESIPADSHLWLKPNDILIQRANTLEYVGVSAIFQEEAGQYIYPDLMMKCEANQKVLPEFLLFTLRAESMRTYFRENATGTAGNMPKINQQTVINAPALLPPLGEQTEIVRRVEILFAFADRLEARLVTARRQVGQLTPALLAKAFRGELVAQDPADEPAAELLKRLAAQRENAPKAKRGRKITNP